MLKRPFYRKKNLPPTGMNWEILLVAGEEELVKVHIHTAHPGNVLEICLRALFMILKSEKYGRSICKETPMEPSFSRN